MHLLGVLGLLVPLLILGGIGVLIFSLARGAQRGGPPITSRALLRAYLRFAYLVSLVIFLVGATFTLTAAFGAAFGHDFSYSQNSGNNCGPGPGAGAPPDAQQGYQSCVNAQGPQQGRDTRQTDNLILGISLLVAGLLIGGGHRAGQLALETRPERADSALARAENLVATFGFGLVTLIAVPSAAYMVARYAILGTQPTPDSGQPDPPGGALATAIVFTLAWAYYITMLIRRRGGVAPAAPGEEPAAS